MLIHFWGVRGSLPSPLRSSQVQAKIAAAVARITVKDLKSPESRMRFLSTLPEWIYGTAGGNTPCVEVRSKSGELFLLDAGSGIREFSVNGKQPVDLHYNLFFSHFHWDHVQGFPFFGQSFIPSSKIDIYSPFEKTLEYIEYQSSEPFFPKNGCYPSVKNQLIFHLVKEGEPFEIGGVKINCKLMNHPGRSYSYSFSEDNKKFIYCTDAELTEKDFDKNDERNFYFKDTDVLVLDSQYNNPEAIKKVNWGHSSFAKAIDFALTWDVKNLWFFHHEPKYDDRKLYSILEAGNSYKKYKALSKKDVKLHISIEGQEIEL